MKINVNNEAKIKEVLGEVQKRTSVREIGYNIILSDLASVERRLGVAKKYLKGVKVDIDHHAQSFCGAYKGTPESTHFTAEHNGRNWVVTSISREACRGATSQYLVTLTDTAKNAIICKMERW